MAPAAAIGWWLLAALHVVPAAALVRPALLETLYGVQAGSVAFLLLHHRAALFLVVALVAGWAALRPAVRPLATVAVGTSMVSFLVIWALGGMPAALRPIAVADLLGLPVLIFLGWRAMRG